MPLVYDDHVVQTFSANTPDNPFRIAVLPRTPGRYWHLSDTQSIHSCSENMPIDPITISYQVSRHSVVRKRFHDLLSSPIGGWVFRHIEMQNTATVMREDDEDIQHTELYGRNRRSRPRPFGRRDFEETSPRSATAFLSSWASGAKRSVRKS